MRMLLSSPNDLSPSSWNSKLNADFLWRVGVLRAVPNFRKKTTTVIVVCFRFSCGGTTQKKRNCTK